MTPRVRSSILRFSGILLVVLGVLHLAVTPSISRMITIAAQPTALAWLRPPMLLNHVVVGILLLPLGVLTAYAAPHAGQGDRWAVVIARATALTVAALPPTLFLLMGMRYAAVPFLCATAIVSVVSVTLLVAAFWPAEPASPAAR